MKSFCDEILLWGSLVLIAFKIVFYFVGYILVGNPISSYLTNLLEIIVFAFPIYFMIILIGSRLISRSMSNSPLICYYLKAIGWIPYAYLLGIIFYLIFFNSLNHYELEKIWNAWQISEICIAVSLLTAWVRKHPRFLAE